jgi:hypothetical protein
VIFGAAIDALLALAVLTLAGVIWVDLAKRGFPPSEAASSVSAVGGFRRAFMAVRSWCDPLLLRFG